MLIAPAHRFRKGTSVKINWLVGQVMVWGLVGGLTVPMSALAATKQVPKASGQDL